MSIENSNTSNTNNDQKQIYHAESITQMREQNNQTVQSNIQNQNQFEHNIKQPHQFAQSDCLPSEYIN